MAGGQPTFVQALNGHAPCPADRLAFHWARPNPRGPAPRWATGGARGAPPWRPDRWSKTPAWRVIN